MEELIEAARRGNDQAFYELISRYKHKLYNTAWHYFNNEAEALEAVQEVTCRAYIHIKKLKEPNAFGSWLGRIMLNYCMDTLKKAKKTIPIEEIEAFQFEDTSQLQLEINMSMEQLRPDFREAVTLRYFNDLSIEEISFVMNRPEGTVKTWISRGLGQLKKIMERA